MKGIEAIGRTQLVLMSPWQGETNLASMIGKVNL